MSFAAHDLGILYLPFKGKRYFNFLKLLVRHLLRSMMENTIS